ncbi:MAG: flagellar biosynthesis protein FlhF, partial [Thalassolituus sp.]
ARFVLRHGPESVAFITLDNYRVAAHDQLRTFSRILGVDLKVVKQGDDLAKAIESVRDKKLVLIDSAGLASQDPHFSVQLSMLKQAGAGITKLLVLPLTSQARCLQENYEHFKGAGLNGCVFTKMDECFSLGAGMSVAALTRLPVTLVTDGPHIPDDLHYPDAARLVNLAEQMARMARTRWQAAEAMSMANQQQSFQHGV